MKVLSINLLSLTIRLIKKGTLKFAFSTEKYSPNVFIPAIPFYYIILIIPFRIIISPHSISEPGLYLRPLTDNYSFHLLNR